MPTPDAALLMQGIPLLRTRTKQQFKNAHILVNGSDYWSLDLDIHQDSPESLRQAIEASLAGLADQEVLPAAPDEAWAAFVQSTVLNWQTTEVQQILCPGAKFGRLRLVMVKA